MNEISDNDEGYEFYAKAPVSFDKNDTDSEEVRLLAARLAPTLEKAEEILALPPEFSDRKESSSNVAEKSVYEDDDMDQELKDLANSEDMLRRELEDIQEFSNLFHFPLSGSMSKNSNDIIQSLPPAPSNTPSTPATPAAAAAAAVVEADVDGGQDMAPEQKYLPPTARKSTTPQSSPARTPRSSRKSASPFLLRMGNQPVPYRTDDHEKSLGVERNIECGWYTVDLTRHLLSSDDECRPGHGVEEICLALPQAKLQQYFIGMQNAKSSQIPDSPLPVRTLMIRIRPDVLCGAVMDAVASSLHTARIWKRQGGHLRALIRSPFDEEKAQRFVVDAQVVTFKGLECRRILLVRVYHSDAAFPDHNPEEAEPFDETSLPLPNDPIADSATDPSASLHLREACALLQRIEYPSTPNKALHRPAQSPTMSDRETMSQSVRKHLLDHYQACPSVKLGQSTLPSLNPEDWPVVQAAWPWIHEVWTELENRDLTYTTLCTTTPFGKFPSLSTLDVHYCSQIRRFSRESMVLQLLKSASDLEEYARQSEYSCANMISLLQPTFEAYELDSPALPEPVPLTAYRLDFVPHQNECPPWGTRVMEALNQIQASSSSELPHGSDMDNLFSGEFPTSSNKMDSTNAEESLRRANEAVMLVLTAFQEQDDEEKGARLARKNMQVMDRLSRMDEHQWNSISVISESDSPKALQAADDMFAKLKVREVPLVKWSVVVGSSTGTCWVTARHIGFSTQLIPIVGKSTQQVFAWDEISLKKSESTPSLLNPLAVSISIQNVHNGETLCSFRPSVSGARLYSLLQIVQSAACSRIIKNT